MNAALNEPLASPDERVVQALLQRGKLKEADLVRARKLQEQDGGDLLQLLGRLGLVSERDHAEACAAELDLPLRSGKDVPELPPEEVLLSLKFMKQFHVVPVAVEPGHVDVLLADPQDAYALDAVRLATGREPRAAVALRSEIDELVERWHGQGRSAMDSIVEGAEGEENFDDVEHLRDLASEAPVIRLVNLVIQRAVELRASDIHIEPFENRLKVRYRVDGVLQEGESPPANLTAAVISRIKIMAKLNIAERRLPQDGRIMLRVQGKELDLRVSTVPTAHGESVVMRLLDRENVSLDLGALGYTDAQRARLREALSLPHGIGKSKRVVAFVPADKVEAAVAGGASSPASTTSASAPTSTASTSSPRTTAPARSTASSAPPPRVTRSMTPSSARLPMPRAASTRRRPRRRARWA